MAVAYQSIGTVAWASASTIAIPKPSGLSVGDLMVAISYCYDASSNTCPAGWTQIQYNNVVSDLSLLTAWKIATSDDVSASTFTFGTATTAIRSGSILRFNGNHATTPISASNNAVPAFGGLLNPTFAMTVTPSANNILIFVTEQVGDGYTGAVSNYAIATDNPTWTEIRDDGSTSGSDGWASIAVSSVRSQTSATGDSSVTGGYNAYHPDWLGHLIAIAPAPTSTNYPITASQGSFSLTGQNALLKIGRKMIAVYTSFVLTGQSALLKIGKRITASFGSFSLTSQVVNFVVHIKNIIFSVDYGSFALSGQTVFMRLGIGLSAFVGSFTLTGQNILLKIGYKMLSTYETFTLTGQDVLLKISKYVSASVGEFTLTGQNIIFNIGRKMSVVVGNFVLYGQNTIVSFGRKMSAGYETFTLTGQNILLHIGKYMRAVYGSFTLTGFIAKFPIYWRTIVKNVVSMVNGTKHTSTWINEDKTNVV